MTTSVVLTTYNQPEALEKALWGYASQRGATFEIVVADDGSGPETAAVVARAASAGLAIVHVWHEDRGFRKTEILNRAILAASGDYLVFSDGDCVPRDDFVAVHRRLAEPDRFLSGGYLKLEAGTSARITREAVESGRAFDASWLRTQGWRPGRRAVRLSRSRRWARLFDILTPTRPSWNGHNASTWKEALLRVNGFDLDMGYGGLDRAVGERLENAGVRGKQVRHQAPCLHLYHERPYRSAEVLARNREIRNRIRRTHETRAPRGIQQMTEKALPTEKGTE